MSTLDQLSAELADLREEMAGMRTQLAEHAQIGAQITQMLQLLREQKAPEVKVSVPSAQPPRVNVEIPAAPPPPAPCDFEIITTGVDGKSVTSYLRRVPARAS